MHDKHLAAAGGLTGGCSLSNHETAWADIADLVEYMSSHPSFLKA